MLGDQELKEFSGTDSALKRAHKEYAIEEDDEDNYNCED